MIDYQLAKELKDAGFPQAGKGVLYNDLGKVSEDTIGTLYVPILEELIEAVQNGKPNSLYLDFNDNWSVYEDPNPEGKWEIRYYENTPVGFIQLFDDDLDVGVANLYLALNKK